MALTDKNKNAIREDVLSWIDTFKDAQNLSGIFTKVEEMTGYIMNLCQKAYDKGVEETKQNQTK